MAGGSGDKAPTLAVRLQADEDSSGHCEDQHLRDLLACAESFHLLDHQQSRAVRTGLDEADQAKNNRQNDRIQRGNLIHGALSASQRWLHGVAVLTGEYGRLAGSRLIDAGGTRRNLGVEA